jgi:hypothetical protein
VIFSTHDKAPFKAAAFHLLSAGAMLKAGHADYLL